MTGLVRDSRTIEVDDETLTILTRKGSTTCYVRTRDGSMLIGSIEYNVIRLSEEIRTDGTRLVEVAPRPRAAQAGAH